MVTSNFHLDLSYHFKGMKNRSPSINKVVEDSKNLGMTYSDELSGDFFNALYQNNPQLSTQDNSQYSQALRAAMNSPRFQHIRMQTQNSLHWSAVGASLITAKLAEELSWDKEEKPPQPKPPKPPKEEEEEKEPTESEESDEKQSGKSEDSEEEEEQSSGKGEEESDGESEESTESGSGKDSSEQSEDESESGEEESKQESSEDKDSDKPKPDSETKDESSEGEKVEEDSEGESEDSDFDENGEDSDGDSDDDSEIELDESESEEPLSPINKNVEKALDDAAKELDNMMGGVRAGSDESLFGSREESKLAELYTALGRNERLAKIIQMIGRMQINQQYLSGVTYSDTTVPVSINTGRDVRNALPQDIGLLLGNSEEFMIFAEKYNNQQLLQRQFEAENTAGKGPMILCIDESGSMYGDKQTWAWSISVAMYFQALKDHRQFAVVKFASHSKALNLPKSTSRMDVDFMKSLVEESYLGGGTNFQPAWNDAIGIINKDKSWKYADIVFITDGFGHYDPEQWRRDKAQYKIRLVTFFVDEHGSFRGQLQYNQQLKNMIELSDAFSLIDDLSESGEKAAFNIIRNKDAKGFIELQSQSPRRKVRG